MSFVLNYELDFL